MRDADAEIVRALPLFSGMEPAHFETLIGAGYLQRFPHRVVLVHEGQKPDFLHVLVQGTVEFFSVSRGRETTLSLLEPPSAFILAAVVLDQLYLKSARTTARSVVVLIPAAAVREVFNKDPAFARAVVSELALRHRTIVEGLKSQRLRTGVERLANWILAYNEKAGGRVASSCRSRREPSPISSACARRTCRAASRNSPAMASRYAAPLSRSTTPRHCASWPGPSL